MPFPSIGQPLRVRLGASDEKYYRTRLVDSSDEHYFIEIPLDQSNGSMAPPDTTDIWVEFVAHDSAICRFRSKRVDTARIPMPVWQIPRPGAKEVEKQQRRNYVRVQADIPVRLEHPVEQGKRQTDVFTRDISGGGMALVIPRTVRLRSGMLVQAKFTLPTTGFPVDAKCEVVRMSERNETGYGIASVKFLEMKESIRQRIIQFTFARQRMLL